MRAAVVFETLWGNTEQVAQAIAEGMKPNAEVTVVDAKIANAALADRVDLLVVGGPTHMWSMSKPSSRKVRTGQTFGRPSAPRDRGIREWMETLPQDRRLSFAAFDTRLNKPSWLRGSAARSIRKALKRGGYAEIMKRQSFRVAHSDGPLVEGELDRAVAWGRELAAKLETAD